MADRNRSKSPQPKKVKRVGKYELGKTIGAGTFAKVKEAVNLETGERFAVKVIKQALIEKEGMGEYLRREIAVMKLLRHKNIVRLVEVMKSGRYIYMVLELVQGGELFDRIVASKRFDEKTARHFFQQLIGGLEFCHSFGIAHRDLKPENLLITSDDTLKISDFGFARIVEEGAGPSNVMATLCGTPHYVAPEVLAGRGYDGRLADLWSAGCILFVMLAGRHPFNDPSQAQLFDKIQRCDFSFPDYFPDGAKALVRRFLTLDPRRRPSFEEIKMDPWFRVDLPAEYASAPVPSQPSESDVANALVESETHKLVRPDAAPAAAGPSSRAGGFLRP